MESTTKYSLWNNFSCRMQDFFNHNLWSWMTALCKAEQRVLTSDLNIIVFNKDHTICSQDICTTKTCMHHTHTQNQLLPDQYTVLGSKINSAAKTCTHHTHTHTEPNSARSVHCSEQQNKQSGGEMREVGGTLNNRATLGKLRRKGRRLKLKSNLSPDKGMLGNSKSTEYLMNIHDPACQITENQDW